MSPAARTAWSTLIVLGVLGYWSLLGARLDGAISWSWWLLLAPVWVPMLGGALLYALSMVLALAIAWQNAREARRREGLRRAVLNPFQPPFAGRRGLTRFPSRTNPRRPPR